MHNYMLRKAKSIIKFILEKQFENHSNFVLLTKRAPTLGNLALTNSSKTKSGFLVFPGFSQYSSNLYCCIKDINTQKAS